MSVHVVYRCYYGGPSERHVRHFAADSVLDWFRSIWKAIQDEDKADDQCDGITSESRPHRDLEPLHHGRQDLQEETEIEQPGLYRKRVARPSTERTMRASG